MKEKTAYLLLGSNVGDRLQNLSSALYALSALGRIEKTSTIYETEAWGYEDQANFLNQAISLKTSFSPTDLLLKIKGIEEQLGRDEAKKWHPRIIDIDILAFNQDVLQSPELTLPHPQWR